MGWGWHFLFALFDESGFLKNLTHYYFIFFNELIYHTTAFLKQSIDFSSTQLSFRSNIVQNYERNDIVTLLYVLVGYLYLS